MRGLSITYSASRNGMRATVTSDGRMPVTLRGRTGELLQALAEAEDGLYPMELAQRLFGKNTELEDHGLGPHIRDLRRHQFALGVRLPLRPSRSMEPYRLEVLL